MIKKRDGISFLLGAGICKYYTDKVSRAKDYELERKNAVIELMDRWLTLRDRGISIEKYLQQNRYKKVAIYGMGILGNHLYEELKASEIEIVGIDRSEIYNNFQIPIYKPEECFDDVELIIITPFEYRKICESLGKYRERCISFQELISCCEEYLLSW